ncbi:glycosyltransferase 87 family protein [Embleya sp. NPDC008237]|uniref:glycosyltransferase 87 family protein n=1 Tax=Embleya sp. NPDC008237 TaxID=3363978 RepID=UPI0036E0A3FB
MPETSRRPQRLLGRLPALAAVLVVASVAAYLAFALTRPATMWWLGDLRVYQAGGRAIVEGDGRLYSMSVGTARLPFTYTPCAALLFTPLAWLPWGALRWVSVGGNLALLGIGAHLAWGMAGVRGTRRLGAAASTAAVLLWTEPVQETLRFGQINLLLLALVLADLSRAPGARLRGCGVGLAAGLKLTPAIVIPYLFLTGRVREGRNALLALGASLFVAFTVLPRESLRYWGGLFLDDTRVGPAQAPGNQSLRGLLIRFTHQMPPPGPVWPAIAMAVGVGGLALAVLVARGRPGDPRRDLAGLCVTALTGLLVSPISWTHHWVWIVPGAVLLADTARRRRGPIRLPAALAAFALVALTAAVPGRRVELPVPVPTGLIWQVPYRDGRELRLAGWDLLLADAYTLAGLAALITIAVGVPATRRKWGSRTAEAVTLDPPEPPARTAPGTTTPAPARA